jgi:hypothetical protein
MEYVVEKTLDGRTDGFLSSLPDHVVQHLQEEVVQPTSGEKIGVNVSVCAV